MLDGWSAAATRLVDVQFRLGNGRGWLILRLGLGWSLRLGNCSELRVTWHYIGELLLSSHHSGLGSAIRLTVSTVERLGSCWDFEDLWFCFGGFLLHYFLCLIQPWLNWTIMVSVAFCWTDGVTGSSTFTPIVDYWVYRLIGIHISRDIPWLDLKSRLRHIATCHGNLRSVRFPDNLFLFDLRSRVRSKLVAWATRTWR